MSEELNTPPGLPEELAAVERALSALAPARPGGLDRDRLMYDAGQAAGRRVGRRRLRAWQGACVLLAGGCVGLAVVSGHGGAKGPAMAREPAGAVHDELAQVQGPGTEVLPVNGSLSGLPQLLMPGGVRIRPTWVSEMAALANGSADSGGMGSGGSGSRGYVPTLRRSEGLDALPDWRQRAVVLGGKQS